MSVTAAVGVIGAVVNYANRNQDKLAVAQDVAERARDLVTTNSLVEYTHGTRVEPLTIIGADCINVDFIADVMQSMQSLFSGYYLQAVAMSTQVYGVSVTKHLDRLNPNRNSYLTETVLGSAFDHAIAHAQTYASESFQEIRPDWRNCEPTYRFRLPTTKNPRAIAFEQELLAMEGKSNDKRKSGKKYQDDDYDDTNNQANTSKYTKPASTQSPVSSSGSNSSGASHQGSSSQNSNPDILDGIDPYYDQNKFLDKQRDEKERRMQEQEAERIKERNGRKASQDEQELERLKDKTEKKEREQRQEMERLMDKAEKKQKEYQQEIEKETEKNRDKSVGAAVVFNDKMVSATRELADLSVGKMISVTFGGGKDRDGNEIRSATIPVSIRLMVNTMSESSLMNLLCSGSMDNSLSERYHSWRSGRISFVRDLILCQDLIDEQKKAMIKDHSGIHGEILRRVNNAKKAGLITKDPSLNVASNLFVISEVTAANIEKKLGGKLNNVNTRNKIFDSGYAMIIAVVDRRYEVVTFYHRGISASTTVTARDMKISNKSNGPDVSDILKAYVAGNSPSL